MGQFIFRMPRNTPQLSYWALDEYLRGSANAGLRVRSGVPLRRKIGSTVEVREEVARGTRRIALVLYSTTLAYFYPDDRVEFTRAGANDRHMATGHWLNKIAGDNHMGQVYRERWERYLFRRSSDGWAREPIAGVTFQGDPAAAAALDASVAAIIAEANAELAAEHRRSENALLRSRLPRGRALGRLDGSRVGQRAHLSRGVGAAVPGARERRAGRPVRRRRHRAAGPGAGQPARAGS